MSDPLSIPRHLNGPPDSANGGIACGEVALRLGGDVEVTLRAPPPLDEPMSIVHTDEGLELRSAGGVLVATGRCAPLTLSPPAPVTAAVAATASTRFAGHAYHAFPTCFSCGPARDPDEALCIHPGPIAADSQEPVAATWIPRPSFEDRAHPGRVHLRYLAGAIDCAGAWAIMPPRGHVVLGRMHLSLREAPRVGEACIVMGWAIGHQGRKHFAGTVAHGEDGRLLGLSQQTWITLANA